MLCLFKLHAIVIAARYILPDKIEKQSHKQYRYNSNTRDYQICPVTHLFVLVNLRLRQLTLFVFNLVQHKTHFIVQQQTAHTKTAHLTVEFVDTLTMIHGNPPLHLLEMIRYCIKDSIRITQPAAVCQQRLLQGEEVLYLLIVQLFNIVVSDDIHKAVDIAVLHLHKHTDSIKAAVTVLIGGDATQRINCVIHRRHYTVVRMVFIGFSNGYCLHNYFSLVEVVDNLINITATHTQQFINIPLAAHSFHNAINISHCGNEHKCQEYITNCNFISC